MVVREMDNESHFLQDLGNIRIDNDLTESRRTRLYRSACMILGDYMKHSGSDINKLLFSSSFCDDGKKVSGIDMESFTLGAACAAAKLLSGFSRELRKDEANS